ncbi:MAG: alpha/beta hydrolase [Rhodobacteraceae bacterium]|nr:alpha/beta hydrolase [Paracoccaceae bacterium]
MIRYFQSEDGLQLAYRDTGDGFPVICLAGLTRNSCDFDHLPSQFPDHRFICPDARGRGESDWDAKASRYTLGIETRDVQCLMEHLDIRSACFIGTSRGGLITMALASLAPERLAGFVLNDIGPRIERVGLDQIAEWIGREPGAENFSEGAGHLARTSRGFANVPHARWLVEARRRYRQSDSGLRLNYDPALRDAFLASGNDDIAEFWEIFALLSKLPGAVIRGANSELLSAATVRKMIQYKPDLLAVEVPDRGHCPFLDEPESLRAIAAVLDQGPRSADNRSV